MLPVRVVIILITYNFLKSSIIHYTATMCGYLILINIDFYDFFAILFSLKTVLNRISKHLEVLQKHFAACRNFNSFLV